LEKGEEVEVENYAATVTDADERSVREVRFCRLAGTKGAGEKMRREMEREREIEH